MASQTEPTTSQLSGAGVAALPRQAGVVLKSKHLPFIDNLHILLMCGVLLDQLNDTYGAIADWEYHDPTTNLFTGSILTTLNGILMACCVGDLFLDLRLLYAGLL